MRLPRLLLLAALAVLCATLSFAADNQPTEPRANAAITQEPHAADNALLAPQMFIPPRSWQKAQLPAARQPDSADNLCYNIHSVVVAEDDHTGVTHLVRESTCTRASRFQMKNADTAAK